MHSGGRRHPYRSDRHTVEAGAWLHRAVVWLIAAGILLGAGLIIWSLLAGGRGDAA